MKSQAELMKKYQEMSEFENSYRQQGYLRIAGVDEAGRGPLAGPVAAAACILNPDKPILGLNDSKKLTAKKRQELYDLIIKESIAWSVILIDPHTIDMINILQATKRAMTQAINNLEPAADFLLLDAIKLEECHQSYESLIKGDARSVSIAAASILAKVTRDRLMLEYDEKYPEFGFASHKGYGTKSHYEALLKYGPLPIHRRSFLRNLEDKRNQVQSK
ncbi:MAG: ribonuclease HII [Eubacteriales bacterium]|jgi:ribonuclease HII|nr:ribonuclease HII [Eubacteriales bacterium]MDD3197331.1 ribonuclease HII [Eubacteriales bacterium]MDD3504023.1 ribonuclease HII [Eubacteriales bacterium]MDD4681640.1 ribonuclease HII [Eubacteriales bacterium]